MGRSLLIRLALAASVALVAATLALGAGPAERKQQVDARLARLHDRIAQAREREQQLSAEIAAADSKIQGLEQQVGDVSRRLAPLEEDLALHQRVLDRLNALFHLQKRRLVFLRRQYRISVDRLGMRLVTLYESPAIGTLDVIFQAGSLDDLVARFELTNHIVAQDGQIVKSVTRSRNEMRRAHAQTRRTRGRAAAVTRVIAARTAEVRSLRDSLVAQENALASAQSQKSQQASSLRAAVEQMKREWDALQQVSAELEAKIQSSQSSGSSPLATSSGLIWPVNGPMTSPFGPRCLNGVCGFHPGIDIGVGYGTPIKAAAAGTVIYASVLGGYGNLIVIDHGGGLSTAYAHQSSFAVTGGSVSQGQVIGYVGSTGYSTGPHLHFEVRVNGKPVNPLSYLP